MSNLYESQDKKEFYVWVDPNDFLANHNLNEIGSFLSTDLSKNAPSGYITLFKPSSIKTGQSPENLMFTENHNFTGFISAFQANLLWKYEAEYNLELSRIWYFKDYPSRLVAIFLFETEEEANKYYKRNPDHVRGRELKRVKTVGKYKYSFHDSSWVDFLREVSMKDNSTIHNICNSYWRGEKVEQFDTLSHWGKKWTESPIFEILLLGRVDLVR